ncbi:hypothetical protein BLX87_22105 [Bacillus sp. VT-16-64]|nr:hypothetical protein BLX87_22105 [Bacillus sp. VT-16-64]
MSVVHKKRYLKDYRAHAELMATRFGYPHIHYMDAAETAERLGSTRYLGGVHDAGTGHIQPMKLVVGTAQAAARAGAHLNENTRVTGITSQNGRVTVATAKGNVTAAKCLIAVNAYGRHLQAGSGVTPVTDVDRQIARAGELLERTRAGREALVKRRRQGTAIAQRLTLVAGADLAIVVAAIAIGWFVPLGMGSALLVGALLVVVTLFLLFATLTPPVRAEQLTQVPLKALPLMTEQWLDTQRKLLPAPATIRGILQARILEWVAVPSSRGFSGSKNRTGIFYVSCIGRWGLLPLAPPGKPLCMHIWL